MTNINSKNFFYPDNYSLKKGQTLIKKQGVIEQDKGESTTQSPSTPSDNNYLKVHEWIFYNSLNQNFNRYSDVTSVGFGLKLSDKDGKAVQGNIDYKDIVEKRGSAYLTGDDETIKAEAKDILERLKSQFRTISENAIFPTIMREGQPQSLLLDKVDFDAIYAETVENVINKLIGGSKSITKLVTDFATALEMALELATKGNFSGNITKS